MREITTIKYNPNGRFGQAANAFDEVSNTDVTVLTSGTDFWLESEESGLCKSGILEHINGWPTERGSIQITYKAGYTRDERQGWGDHPCSDLVQACVVTMAKAWREMIQVWKSPLTGNVAPGPITQERLQDYSVSYEGSAASLLTGYKVSLPQEAKELLGPYQHYGRDLV